jgi:hypothetical protein
MARKNGVSFDQVSGLVELLRWQGRGLRGSFDSARGLVEACYGAIEVGIEPSLIAPALEILTRYSEEHGFSTSIVTADLATVVSYQDQAEEKNRARLGRAISELNSRGLAPSEGLFLGDCAVLIGVYGGLRAFEAQLWTLGVPGVPESGVLTATDESLPSPESGIRIGGLGVLAEKMERTTHTVDVDGNRIRVPDLPLLITLLAARVGNPQANPTNPTWAHLAVAVKSCGRSFDVDIVSSTARDLEVLPMAHRGLAIARTLFPELGRVIPWSRLDLPTWEKTIALRLAAKRLISVSLGAED